MTQKTINLDIADFDQLEASLLTPLGRLTTELVEAHGPAGGNPIYAFTGSEAALLVWLLKEYTFGDVDEALHYLTGSTR